MKRLALVCVALVVPVMCFFVAPAAADPAEVAMTVTAECDWTGGPGTNHKSGNDKANVLCGGGGNDFLKGCYASTAASFVCNASTAATDSDTLVGGPGCDDIEGNFGDDLLIAGGGCGDGEGDALVGGPGNDRLRGGPGNEWSDGGPGRDVLRGGGGSDHLMGGSGNDLLIAGAGQWESLEGGRGFDRCVGKRSDDFRGCEVISYTN